MARTFREDPMIDEAPWVIEELESPRSSKWTSVFQENQREIQGFRRSRSFDRTSEFEREL